MKLREDKDVVTYGWGTKNNVTLYFTLLPFEICLLPFVTYSSYKHQKAVTFRWLFLFVTAFHKQNETHN